MKGSSVTVRRADILVRFILQNEIQTTDYTNFTDHESVAGMMRFIPYRLKLIEDMDS